MRCNFLGYLRPTLYFPLFIIVYVLDSLFAGLWWFPLPLLMREEMAGMNRTIFTAITEPCQRSKVGLFFGACLHVYVELASCSRIGLLSSWCPFTRFWRRFCSVVLETLRGHRKRKLVIQFRTNMVNYLWASVYLSPGTSRLSETVFYIDSLDLCLNALDRIVWTVRWNTMWKLWSFTHVIIVSCHNLMFHLQKLFNRQKPWY